MRIRFFMMVWAVLAFSLGHAQTGAVSFVVALDRPEQVFDVTMSLEGSGSDSTVLKMPAWTPGYYKLLNFADQVSNFQVKVGNKTINTRRHGKNGWAFALAKGARATATYRVKATTSFVANPYLDTDRGYLEPTGVLMYVDGHIEWPARVEVKLPEGWKAATGLTPAKGVQNIFTADNFDTLYDSPFLLGPLETFPEFQVRGIPHRFIAWQSGITDQQQLMNDLQKIVAASVNVIGDIPYPQYTFLAIDHGRGGIEHLNSTTFGIWDGAMSEKNRKRFYTFLAHEYFHHYNVKRIRPVELGPFDYDNGSRTNMLWVSEGITVYYDELVTRRAGLLTDEELLESLHDRLLGFEGKPGNLFQSATQASYNTWEDGPFGRNDGKTVSVYDKGAILGLMLDFTIRHSTSNQRSLDDVMRILYREFYQGKKRGFSEAEFQQVCERVAGTKLTELFEYACTVKPIDYRKYFEFGGLTLSAAPDYRISTISNPTPLQAQILKSWLGK